MTNLLLATADEAAEDLKEEVDDGDADEGEADGNNVRQDSRGIVPGSRFEVANRRGHGGMHREGGPFAFGEGRERSEAENGQHLFHFVLSFWV